MNPFSPIISFFRFFSIYADPFEKKVDVFLRNIRRRSKKDLEILIQQDLVRLTVFLEYKFRGYKKLRKRYRRKLYQNAEFIAKDFAFFFDEHREGFSERLKMQDIPSKLKSDDRMVYLFGIMEYLKPGTRLQYQEAAMFEKLLRDPTSEMLVGDCNQITTLYIYLYALRFSVGDLKVKILSEHICLHYKDVDIETTNGTLMEYKDYIFLSDVEEIVASNLLDIPDPSEKQFEISAANMLKSAELAFHFSSHRATVEKNLFIAYHNMALHYAKKKDFRNAVLFANKSGNTKLQKSIFQMEAVSLLGAKKYTMALERFRKIGDVKGERACYQNELADLSDRLKSCKTLGDYKRQTTTLKRMKELALKIDNREVLNFVNEILGK